VRSFWSLSLQRQLAIAIGLLLVPVIAAAIWSGTGTLRERSLELGDQTRIVAVTTAAYINRDLSYLDGTGETLQMNPNIQALDRDQSQDLFRRIADANPNVTCIDLVRRSGDLVARAMSGSMSEVGAPPQWAAQVFSTGTRWISPPFSAATGGRYVVLGYPVHDSAHELVGALGFFVDLKAVQESLSTLPFPGGSVVTVANAEGLILARSQASGRRAALR
jgi:hypothetical protein